MEVVVFGNLQHEASDPSRDDEFGHGGVYLVYIFSVLSEEMMWLWFRVSGFFFFFFSGEREKEYKVSCMQRRSRFGGI